ncbi:tetratricopeptide repeat protein [Nonomuraea muscovyensis]|uniref:tetratricopeptide repeat protein n=1 Tax=Nonomuraea muscovyensis TaxID=1124761 RepID=UPI0033C8D9DE
MGIARNGSKSDEKADKSSREWCAEAAARLHAERPEDALSAARAAVDLDPAGEWPHRLTGLALERLGRDRDALPPARHAVRLAPGSWAARLGLATVLSHLPGHWDEAAGQAALARRYAPERPEPLVLEGDLALLRGTHDRAEAAYRTALDLDPGHLQARVNLGLALLRWDPARAHHDPAWPIDPRETGRARRALEVWSRQAHLLAALATVAAATLATAFDLGGPAGMAGLAGLAALVPLTLRQARRVRIWRWVPAMLARDPWLGAAVLSAVVSVGAFAGWLGSALLPGTSPFMGPVWGGLGLIAVLSGPAHAALRLLAQTWRGHPLQALFFFTTASFIPHPANAPGTDGPEATSDASTTEEGAAQHDAGGPAERAERAARGDTGAGGVHGVRVAREDVGAGGVHGVRVARRNAGVALWILIGRTWSVLAALTAVALVAEPRAAPVAVAAGVLAAAAPYPLLRAFCRVPRPADHVHRAAGRGPRPADHVYGASRQVPRSADHVHRGSGGVPLSSGRARRGVGATGRAYRDDPWPAGAVVLLVLAAAGCAAGGALGAVWARLAGPAALAVVAVMFALLSARAWWRGVPGPWRSSLLRCDLPAGADPSVPLHPRVRRAFAYARSAVLTFGDPLGPRMVGAATSVGPAGDLRVVVEDEAWQAVEADPRVAVFAADPERGRHWVEVRGIAVAGPGSLRVTPKQVLVGEFPGRHQRH